MKPTTSARARLAATRLDNLLAARPEYRHQLLDDWLQAATGGEVRRAWHRVAPLFNGREIPAWARQD